LYQLQRFGDGAITESLSRSRSMVEAPGFRALRVKHCSQSEAPGAMSGGPVLKAWAGVRYLRLASRGGRRGTSVLDGDDDDSVFRFDVDVDEDQPTPRAKDEPEAFPLPGQGGSHPR